MREGEEREREKRGEMKDKNIFFKIIVWYRKMGSKGVERWNEFANVAFIWC